MNGREYIKKVLPRYRLGDATQPIGEAPVWVDKTTGERIATGGISDRYGEIFVRFAGGGGARVSQHDADRFVADELELRGCIPG